MVKLVCLVVNLKRRCSFNSNCLKGNGGGNRNISTKIQVIGQLSNIYISASHFNVQPVVGVLHHMPRFIPNQREVVDILHMPLSLISDKDYQKEMEMSFPSYGFISPYYDLNGEVVWGATAMIISEFSLILSDI